MNSDFLAGLSGGSDAAAAASLLPLFFGTSCLLIRMFLKRALERLGRPKETRFFFGDFQKPRLTFQSRLSAGTKKAFEGSCGNLTACAVKVYPNKADGRTACRDISWERDRCAQVHNPCDVAALSSVPWLLVCSLTLTRATRVTVKITISVAFGVTFSVCASGPRCAMDM